MMRLPQSLFPHVSKEGTSAAEAVWGADEPTGNPQAGEMILEFFPFSRASLSQKP